MSAAAIGYAFTQASERLLPLTVVRVSALQFNGAQLARRPARTDLLAIAKHGQALAA